eukprot:CAMPEP_0119331804 /NCGR_PEP_ID=MMETSP1333-20130426/81419_1 /TAXON_ID=418940 /ORGANISM="Scyphosphaera apsteinii, Strain RCC1455" /LENGTH=36 /DNA_ID= /DNA_START= /DNA_END= /DNA_ORIENTATION=
MTWAASSTVASGVNVIGEGVITRRTSIASMLNNLAE